MAENAQLPTNGTNTNMSEGLDASNEADINPEATQPDAMTLDGANETEPSSTRKGVTDAATALESRIPAKKDATLREFLGKMDDYAPIVGFASTIHFQHWQTRSYH